MMYRVLLSPFFSSLFFETCGTCVTGGVAAGVTGLGAAGVGTVGEVLLFASTPFMRAKVSSIAVFISIVFLYNS